MAIFNKEDIIGKLNSLGSLNYACTATYSFRHMLEAERLVEHEVIHWLTAGQVGRVCGGA